MADAKILIVDDERLTGEALRKNLQMDGFRADVTTSAGAALEMLGTDDYAVVIADNPVSRAYVLPSDLYGDADHALSLWLTGHGGNLGGEGRETHLPDAGDVTDGPVDDNAGKPAPDAAHGCLLAPHGR